MEKSTFAPILHDMIAPLRERTEVFLSKETTGTDDVVEVMDVKRAYMSFFASIFNADQEGVLTSEGLCSVFVNFCRHSLTHSPQ